MARYFVERVDTPLPEASSGESKDGAPLLISHSLDVRVGGKLPPHLAGGKQGEQDSLLPFGAQLRTWSRACQQEFWHTRRRFWGAQRLGKLQAACRRRQLSVREVDALPNSAARMPFCSRPSPLPCVYAGAGCGRCAAAARPLVAAGVWGNSLTRRRPARKLAVGRPLCLAFCQRAIGGCCRARAYRAPP